MFKEFTKLPRIAKTAKKEEYFNFHLRNLK